MKYAIAALALLLLLGLIWPGAIPRLLRRLGLILGDTARAGMELATGEEIERSPLARYEAQVGRLLEDRALREARLSPDEAAQARVAALGARVARGARWRQIPYRFRLIEAEEPNAFAIPGGAVFISSGLLALCGPDDDALAGVLGHEIAHIDLGHALRSRAASAALRRGAQALFLGRSLIAGRIAAAVEQLLVQGYRQDQELEADRLGARLAARAGLDPRGIERLLDRLSRRSPDGAGPVFEVLQYFRSHPPARERIAALREAA